MGQDEVFEQSGGVNTMGTLSTGVNGEYDLTNGALSAASEFIGTGGTATFDQTGGSNAVSGTLTIGATGEHNLPSANSIVDNGTILASANKYDPRRYLAWAISILPQALR